MNTLITNLFEVDAISMRVICMMLTAGVLIMKTAIDNSAIAILFSPVMLLCMLTARAVGEPLGIYLAMDTGEYLVFSGMIGMCASLLLVIAFTRWTRTML